MRLGLDLCSTLRHRLTVAAPEDHLNVPAGETLATFLERLGVLDAVGLTRSGMAASGTWIIMINDRIVTAMDTELHEGDLVSVFPFVPGG